MVGAPTPAADPLPYPPPVHTRAGPRPEQARTAKLSRAARSSDREQEQEQANGLKISEKDQTRSEAGQSRTTAEGLGGKRSPEDPEADHQRERCGARTGAIKKRTKTGVTIYAIR